MVSGTSEEKGRIFRFRDTTFVRRSGAGGPGGGPAGGED